MNVKMNVKNRLREKHVGRLVNADGTGGASLDHSDALRGDGPELQEKDKFI